VFGGWGGEILADENVRFEAERFCTSAKNATQIMLVRKARSVMSFDGDNVPDIDADRTGKLITGKPPRFSHDCKPGPRHCS
jgi:hypothetical protein